MTKNIYDTNRLGTYVFVGDRDRVENLDDLYWSYVSEYMSDYNGHRPYTRSGKPKDELKYLKDNMEYASFNSVGLRLTLARANQYAKQRLAKP